MTSEQWSQISNGLVYSAITVLAIALVAFALDLAVGSGVGRMREMKQRRATQQRATSGGSTMVDTSVITSGSVSPDERWARIGVSLSVLAATLISMAVLTRGLSVQRPPWGNMYEFTVTSVAALLVIWVSTLGRRKEWRELGILVVLFCLLLLGVALIILYTESGQLVPALKSYWLWIHVTAAIISSAVFTVGSLASVLYLFAERTERRLTSGQTSGVMDAFGSRLPSTKALDRVAYQTIAFAFPLWFFAVAAGAVWAQDAWGRYWGWDPKETWSFITLVIYAAYLHARSTAGWRGRRAAIIAIAGLVAFFVSYFVVNIYIVGLHSYAGT